SFDPAAAERGKVVFTSTGRCASCHLPAMAFTDVNLGVLHDPSETGMNPVRASRLKNHKYRTTPLRALSQHPPYFHDGSAATLADGNAVGSTTACEVGSDGTVDPRLGSIPILYVMTPIGFRPAESTLQCPMVGHCINHPSTIDLSRVFGPGTENAPLPAHSHIV